MDYADYCMIKKKLILKNAYVIGAWDFYTDIQLFAVKTWGNSPLNTEKSLLSYINNKQRYHMAPLGN